MTRLTLARHAMATRFELVLFGPHTADLQAAGEEALDEVDRLEKRLSLYRASSAVADVNARAHQEAVRVQPELFHLLQTARRLHRETGGAFDITIGPLMRCWGFREGSGAFPAPEALAEARARVGMNLVELDPERFTVRFQREGVQLDLGGIGKGYAIDQAMELLREAGIEHALLHGGTSTVAAIGAPPDNAAWEIGIPPPPAPTGATGSPRNPAPPPVAATVGTSPQADPSPAESAPVPFAIVPLRNEALSVSAARGKFFEQDGRVYGHVLDPRTGHPAAHALLAAVVHESATEADALSTALLTVGLRGWIDLVQARPDLRALVVGNDTQQRQNFPG